MFIHHSAEILIIFKEILFLYKGDHNRPQNIFSEKEFDYPSNGTWGYQLIKK